MDSGTKTGARITSPSIGPRSPGSRANARAIMSLMYATPSTSSKSSPTTGMREKPDRVARCRACRSDLSSSIHTTSVRGTITSRTMVSPRSKTLCSISRSVSSTTPRLPAMSTSSRSSISEENGTLPKTAAGGDRVADQNQQRGDRREHLGQPSGRPGERQPDRVGVLSAESSGQHADGDVGDHHHDRHQRDTDPELEAPGAECDLGHHDGRGDLRAGPQQQQQVGIPGSVLGDRVQGRPPRADLPGPSPPRRAGETMVIAASAAASSPAIGTSAAAMTSNSTSMLSTSGSAPSARGARRRLQLPSASPTVSRTALSTAASRARRASAAR